MKVSFDLPRELYDWLHEEAHVRRISKSELLRLFCAMGQTVALAGVETLEQYCVNREQGATANYLECPRVEVKDE